MNDDTIQANLCYRTLQPGHNGRCKRCAHTNTLGHDEWCLGRKDYKVSRHESVKHHLAAALKSIPSSSVTVEPYIFGTNRRNDIKITIDDGMDRPVVAEEYDLKVVSLYAPTHQASLRTNGRTREERAAAIRAEEEGKLQQDMEGRMNKVLGQQARKKVTALPGLGTRSPFYPIVMSTGGYLEVDTNQKLREWKNWKMPGVSYAWMLTSVSVALARARGRTFLA